MDIARKVEKFMRDNNLVQSYACRWNKKKY